MFIRVDVTKSFFIPSYNGTAICASQSALETAGTRLIMPGKVDPSPRISHILLPSTGCRARSCLGDPTGFRGNTEHGNANAGNLGRHSPLSAPPPPSSPSSLLYPAPPAAGILGGEFARHRIRGAIRGARIFLDRSLGWPAASG